MNTAHRSSDPFGILDLGKSPSQKILGVDPGSHGALGLIGLGSGFPFVDAADIPIRDRGKTVTNNVLDARAFAKLVNAWKPTVVIVEDSQPMPNRSEETADGKKRAREPMPASIAFTFGGFCLGIAAVCEALGYDVFMVRSAVWKRAAGLSKVGDRSRSEVKAESLSLARKLWPAAPLTLARHEARAEALLIARFGFSTQVRLF